MGTRKASSDAVFKVITKHLDHKPRAAVERRYQAMIRELKFLEERRDETLTYLRKRNWGDERLMVLFGLNCIYQEVLGPLEASTRSGQSGIGMTYPITHGAVRFDKAHAVRIRNAADDFFEMVIKLGFLRYWMTKNTCGDLIYYIAQHEREDEAEERD